MINIRPVSDLRNKYTEIEELVLKENEAVYLTKNGYGTMVVLSLEKYSKLMKEVEERELMARFGKGDVEKALDKSEEDLDNPDTEYLTHEEIFSKARRMVDEE